jgi:alkylation response protein AidB-like acyl-CoA dehydrogenase
VATFDLRRMMDFGFTAERARLREETIEFARSELESDLVTRDETLAFDPEMWRRRADFGILESNVPVEYGGQGRGL